MPIICPVCSKKYYSSFQNILQCTFCQGWVHHGNRLDCSGLTDNEFQDHCNDGNKPFKCQTCFGEEIAKANSYVFTTLPFPVESVDNLFGKPVLKSKQDVTSMTASQLKNFVEQCENIKNQLRSNDNDDLDDNDLSVTTINSKYYNFKQSNSL